ncbi:MAG TPA: LuxR C-terminal-related transcriptional regulator [Pseudonocardia sp.]|jgi:DNA-binding CsgD family transcriptional regulator
MRPDGLSAAAVDPELRVEWAGRGTPLPAPSRDDVADILLGVRSALDASDLPDPACVVDYPDARRVLTDSWGRVFSALSGVARSGGSPDLDVYLDLLNEIRRVEAGLQDERLRQRDAGLGRLREALALLRDASSTERLVAQATVAACALGFDRSILSRIEDSSWIPEKVFIERDARWSEEILRVGQTNPQVLDRTLVETEMVRRRVGILVTNVQERPAVHRPIADASLSTSYAAAPLVAGGDVVGFVHADCYYQRRNPDDFDRQLLTMFAEGLGQALGRTTMMDRLLSVRSSIDEVAGTLSHAEGEPVRLGGDRGRPPPGFSRMVVQRGRAGYEDLISHPGEGSTLTRREVEVLRLMAAGDTNGRIGRRLVISEGTVKSHVKHILRKLGAANRAEAVSRWLGMEHGRGSDGRRDG